MNKQIDLEECISFGAWLRGYRYERIYPYAPHRSYRNDFTGLSYRDLSNKTGISKDRIKRIENSGNDIKVWEFKALMKAMNIDPVERERLFNLIERP